MSHSRLGELEELQLRKSGKFGANATGLADSECESDAMSESVQAVVDKLTPEQQKRARNLWDELIDLKVKPGLRNRLMGLGHMGAFNDPIWTYIYKLRTGAAKKVRDRGAWLVKCLLNDKLKHYKNN